MSTQQTPITDLELLDKYCEECLAFIDPFLFREVERRGLYSYINRLPAGVANAKATIRARLSQSGRYVGDPEMEQLAGWVSRLEFLRQSLLSLNMADSFVVAPVLIEMTELTHRLTHYYH